MLFKIVLTYYPSLETVFVFQCGRFGGRCNSVEGTQPHYEGEMEIYVTIFAYRIIKSYKQLYRRPLI
jgi:hypothetical protein